ncbi:MAG: class I SAM-dependent methyltransferase [Cyclobacteriaceae bacterium]|nr:class I SAM-dependent methyltransferase [Cyclobacteriaceae bacterium]MCH8515313.1 class I SAM-dependent methyltransferase [Cyclobacteriaceae bacterium]
MEKLDKCPLCHHQGIKKQYQIIDRFQSSHRYSLYSCDSCSVIFTNPRPKKEEIKKHYHYDEYTSHQSKKRSVFDYIYGIIQRRNERHKWNKLKKYINNGGTHLDYGAGIGKWVDYLSIKNVNAEGYEPIAINNHKKITSDFNKLIYKQYTTISLWHVLEHVHEINDRVEQLSNMLTSEGRLIIALPNHDSYDSQYFKKYWVAWDVPRHLYHWNKDSIQKYMKQKGFILDSIYPLPFDAYYISFLSYNLKNKNIFNSIRAVVLGWISNRKAKKTQNYSSNIYVFKKL